MLHPQVAAIDCRKCSKFACDLKTGKFFERGNGLLIERGPEGPPCRTDKAICPKGEPGKSDLTKQSQQVLQHYLECEAVGEWPDDEIVRQNAAILRSVLDDCRGKRQRKHHRQDIEQLVISLMRSRGV